jgi:hypothetical protein
MARLSYQRTDLPSTPVRHRRYRVPGTLSALLLLAGGAYLGLALGDWILFDGAALCLLIAVALNASDALSTSLPDRPPDMADSPPGGNGTD